LGFGFSLFAFTLLPLSVQRSGEALLGGWRLVANTNTNSAKQSSNSAGLSQEITKNIWFWNNFRQ
jgi:hypothetical protein